MTNAFTVKNIALLALLKEDAGAIGKSNDERFGSNFMLFAGEKNKLLFAVDTPGELRIS